MSQRKMISILSLVVVCICFFYYVVLSEKEERLGQPIRVIEAQQQIELRLGTQTFVATAVDDNASEGFKTLLKEGELTLTMEAYGGFEKVAVLPHSLSTRDEVITTALGDITLYQGNQLAIYYAPNTYSLTRLAKIEDTTGLKQALGTGDVMVTLSLIGGK